MRNEHRLARNTVYLVLARGANGLILLLLSVAVSRLLGTHLFGVYAFITTVVLTASFLADFGLDLLMVREVSQEPQSGKTRLNRILGLKLLTATTTILSVIFLFRVVPLPSLTEKLLWLYSVSLIFTGLIRTLWHFGDTFGRFGSHAALWAGESGLKAVIGGGALLIWRDLRLMILGLIGAEVIALLVTWVWVASKYGPISPVFQPRLWTDLVLQATPIALGSLLSVLYLRLDVILLEVLKGEEAVGVYSAASRLVEALIILPTSLSLTVLPEFARQAKTGHGFIATAGKYVGVSLGVGVTLGMLLFSCSTSLIVYIYGARFAAAAGVLQILSLGTGFLFALPVLSSLLVAWGRERLNSLFLLLGTLSCGSLHLLLIPRYGVMGAAWTVLISEVALTLLYVGGLWTLRGKRSAVSNQQSAPS